MKKAVIYARYSSDNQSEQSIDGQVRVCKEYAERNNISIVDSYIDRAMTGTNDRRPEFQRMIKDSYKKEWDCVIVYKLDRFSRDKYETVLHRKTLRDNGVKLVSAMENIPDTPEGIILEGLLESLNQYFSAELSQKIKRGMRESRIKGTFQGGAVAYGYKLENKKLVINEHEAAVVKYMFEKFDSGYYINDILLMLEAKGIKNRGRPFNYYVVSRILESEHYTGVYHYGDEEYKNMYPQIIDKDVYERVRAKSHSLIDGISKITNYIFSRKLVCGYCGESINGSSGTNKDGVRRYYYRCEGKRKNPSGCPKTALPKDLFERFVIHKVISELNKPEVMNKLLDKLLYLKTDRKKLTEHLHILEQEQQEAKTAINNLINFLTQGPASQILIERINKLEEQVKTLEKNIAIEREKINMPLDREPLRKYYSDVLKRHAREIAAVLVKKIKLYNDKMEILYTSPLKRSPDDDQGSFYDATFKNPFTSKQPTIEAKYCI